MTGFGAVILEPANLIYMAFLRYFKKIQLLDNFIRRKATGNQQTFAQKAGMSRSLLNLYLAEMKEMGFPISYSKERTTYYYQEEGNMVTSLFEKAGIEKEELKKYSGGADYQFALTSFTAIDQSNLYAQP